MDQLIKIENTPSGPSLRDTPSGPSLRDTPSGPSLRDTPSGPSLRDTTIGDESVPTVNARELHEFLESKQKFSDWIKKRIEKLRLLENKDFCTASQTYETANGGYSSRLEYFLSLEIAKHVALMENTGRGFEVREYFIECEKQLRTLVTVASSSTVDIGEAAKILKYQGTGRNNLFKFLRREGALMKNNAPKQEYVNKGWFKLVEYKINGEVKIKTLVYQKGLDGIRKMLNEAGLLPEDR